MLVSSFDTDEKNQWKQCGKECRVAAIVPVFPDSTIAATGTIAGRLFLEWHRTVCNRSLRAQRVAWGCVALRKGVFVFRAKGTSGRRVGGGGRRGHWWPPANPDTLVNSFGVRQRAMKIRALDLLLWNMHDTLTSQSSSAVVRQTIHTRKTRHAGEAGVCSSGAVLLSWRLVIKMRDYAADN